MATPLICGRVKNVRIRRIQDYIIHACVLTDGQYGLPGLAAVRRFVEAAVSAWSPERSRGRDVHDLRVSRINDYAADVLRFLQPEIFPTLSAVIRAIDSIAVADAALRIRFARANPNNRGIIRIEFDPADRI